MKELIWRDITYKPHYDTETRTICEYNGYVLSKEINCEDKFHSIDILLNGKVLRYGWFLRLYHKHYGNLEQCLHKAMYIIDNYLQTTSNISMIVDKHDDKYVLKDRFISLHNSDGKEYFKIGFKIGEYYHDTFNVSIPIEKGIDYAINITLDELFKGWECRHQKNMQYSSILEKPDKKYLPVSIDSYCGEEHDVRYYGRIHLYYGYRNDSKVVDYLIKLEDYDEIAPRLFKPKGWTKTWKKTYYFGKASIIVDNEGIHGYLTDDNITYKHTMNVKNNTTQDMADHLKSNVTIENLKNLKVKHLQNQLDNLTK